MNSGRIGSQVGALCFGVLIGLGWGIHDGQPEQMETLVELVCKDRDTDTHSFVALSGVDVAITAYKMGNGIVWSVPMEGQLPEVYAQPDYVSCKVEVSRG